MTLAAPYFLLALLGVGVVALAYLLLERRRARKSGVWSTPALLPNMVHRPRRGLGGLPATLFLLALSFLIVGFARPQRILDNALAGSPTVVLAIDVSGSMAADDGAPTRILAARKVATTFLNELPRADRAALLTFGNTVSLVVAPTDDRQQVIAALPRSVAPAGTAIGDAISEAAAVVVASVGQGQAGAHYRPGAILLISDGAQTAGGTTPQAAAITAQADGVPIDTIAVGTRSGIVTQTVVVDGVRAQDQLPARPILPRSKRSRRRPGARSSRRLQPLARRTNSRACTRTSPHRRQAAAAGTRSAPSPPRSHSSSHSPAS